MTTPASLSRAMGRVAAALVATGDDEDRSTVDELQAAAARFPSWSSVPSWVTRLIGERWVELRLGEVVAFDELPRRVRSSIERGAADAAGESVSTSPGDLDDFDVRLARAEAIVFTIDDEDAP